MTKITNQKILELALTSSDPLIKRIVDKLIFALRLKYADEDLVRIHDTYRYHHYAVLHIHDYNGKPIKLSIAWKNEEFAVVSIEHQYYEGTASDAISGEKASHHQLLNDMAFKAP